MNINMITPKNDTQHSLISITKNCQTLIEQTHRKPEETLEFKMIKPRETFHFRPPIQVKGGWMIGPTDLEIYSSIYDITEENNKFELYKFPDETAGSISYTKVREEIERDLDISDITAADLQDDIIVPIINEEFKGQVTKRIKDEHYMNLLSFYIRSVFQDFKSFLRTQIHLVEVDIKLVLDEYNSSFITYEIPPAIYTFEDNSEVLVTFFNQNIKGKSIKLVLNMMILP